MNIAGVTLLEAASIKELQLLINTCIAPEATLSEHINHGGYYDCIRVDITYCPGRMYYYLATISWESYTKPTEDSDTW